jgi:HD superfamily phosphohydrolase
MGGITSLLGIGTTSTRYEHSLGAMLLVRLLAGTVEEQAAALLHDVSHIALSHVMDYVFDTPSRQAFHDDVKEQYVGSTVIPQVCAEYGIDWRLLLDEERWPLLEQPSPLLCADRIDYSLRDAVSPGFLHQHDVADALPPISNASDPRLKGRRHQPVPEFANTLVHSADNRADDNGEYYRDKWPN